MSTQIGTVIRNRPCLQVYFFGGSLALLGLLVAIGWLRHEPSLIRLVPGFSGMPASAAVTFLLSGLGLIAVAARSQALRACTKSSTKPRRLMDILAAILPAAVMLMALVEWFTGISLGLSPNPEEVRQWLGEAGPNSAAMRPLAAVALGSIGLATGVAAWMHGPRANVFAHGLALLAIFIGFLGMIGEFANFGEVFSWYLGPFFLTGLGLVAAGFALLALLHQHSEHLLRWASEDANKIGLIAGGLILVTGFAGLIGGFAVLYPQAVGGLEDSLALSLRSRTDKLEGAIEQAWQDTNGFANQPLRVEAMRRFDANPGDTKQRVAIGKVAQRYLKFGFTGVVFRDVRGMEVAGAGTFTENPELSVRLNTPAPSRLLWNKGFVLHAKANMVSEGVVVGTLEAERRLAVGEGLNNTVHFGDTLDFAVCAPVSSDAMDCFPFRSTGGKLLRSLPTRFQGELIPMAHALAGKTGIVHTLDYRGIQVIAAHQPIGSLGLGGVLKIDAEQLYSPITARLKPLMIMMLLLGGTAVSLFRFQVMPLMGKLTSEINERKKAEAGLEQARAEIAEITNTLGEGVYVVDVEGLVSFVNPEAERLLGWTAAELVGRNGHDLFHSRSPDGTVVSAEACPVHQTIHTGRSYRGFNDWFLRKDGSFVPVSIISSPIVRNGIIKGSVASFYDITQQLAQERALRESEERFRLISTAATDGIVTMDSEGLIEYWNPAAAKMFGYSEGEVIGQELHNLLAPSRFLADSHRGLQRFRETGTGPLMGKPIEVTAVGRTGAEFPVELSISALRIKGQWHALGVIRDISERKRTEDQIRHLADYDFLTDLPNRRLFVDRLNQGLVLAQRYRRSLAVLYLDLDRFKQINDTLGHDVGDGLLVAVAGRLRDCVRGSDTASRLGGDEFGIVLVEVSQPQDAAVVAEKIIGALVEPIRVGKHDIKVSTSIGIAIYPVDGTDDALALIRKADMAMYDAKSAGRNRYAFAGPFNTA